ncbi:MAG: mannose-1-phosphate guanylyltransferase/mannose-6-phosphate isomerase [Gammaproteobacteria bacterium]
MVFIPVIICGGSGARLWPLSRSAMPKPFAPLPGRADNRSLLDLTYSRLAALPDVGEVMTVCAAEHVFLCRRAFDAAMPKTAHDIIGEPYRRNTAAAVAVAAMRAMAKFGEDAMLLVLPADHLIRHLDVFADAASRAADAAKKERIVLFGITPNHPATGYGYIQKGDALNDDGVFAVRRFVEKPQADKAAQMMEQGGFLWNAGMFCFRAGVLQKEMQKHAPEILQLATQAAKNIDAETYRQFPEVSFDIALMEKTNNAAVAEADKMGWSDLGTWRAIGDTLAADENNNKTCGDVVLHNSKDCIVIGGKGRLIATAGATHLHIIDSGDALLVANAESGEQQTRELFAELQKQNRPQAANAQTELRPWGGYEVLLEAEGCKVKRISVLPGARLSLQSHNHRSEHWTTVQGAPTVVINDKEFDMPKDSSCRIPRGAKHRIINRTKEQAVIIEVQLGDYLGEDDITRYEDDYGRK